MSVRRETIILELEDNASAEALRAAAAFRTLNTSIGRLSGSASKTRGLQSARRDVDALGKSLERSGASIDKFSGRLSLLGTAAMALGPALIPIGAAAIPAIATLTAGMGAAAGAAGVMILAFQGVGDAVTAVSDYRLSPTADNLAKVREEMEKLGPAGADFVMAIDRAMPAFRDLQMTAREGMFPGLARGLDELMTQLPGVRDLVSDLSTTVGTLGEATADALVNDSDWQEFFAHIGTDGASALENFGRATGNFVAGVANLLEAMTGIGGGSAGMLETSRAFREWADNLEHTEGFKEFADYVRQSGPQVAEFLSSAGSAMVGLVEAAAPWGQVVLPALTALADITGAIAGSPLGPPLFAAAAAMLAFNKASALMAPRLERAKTAFSDLGPSIKQSASQIRTDVGTLTSNMLTAGAVSERTAARSHAAWDRLRDVGKQAAGAGAGIAAFGFMASGAADKMGLSNTALLTMAGSMAGPWGAAAGAAIGLAIDFAKANDDVEAAVSDAATAVSSANFTEIGAQLRTATEAVDEFKKTTDSMWGDSFSDIGGQMAAGKNWVEGLFGKSDAEELQERLNATRTEFSNLVDAGAKLGEAFNIDVGGTMSQKLQGLQDLATKAQPAMSALGITWEDLAAAAGRGDGSLQAMVSRMGEWQSAADSVAGRTDSVGDAISQLGDEAISTADSASALAAALDALISPEQNLIAAQDELTSSIRHLGDDLDKQNKTLQGNSDAAIKNRAAISDRVTAIQQMIQAEAEAGRGPEVVAESLAKQRQALIDSARAAGLNKQQVEALINQMNLTPDLVKTVFESAGIDETEQKARNLADQFRKLPKDVKTDIRANGIPESEAGISRLAKKYNLTPKQVRTIASLQDNASGPIGVVVRRILGIPDKTAKITVDTGSAISNVRAVQAVINSLQGKTVTVTTLQKTVYGAGKMAAIAQGRADGGEVLGQRHPYGDKVLVALAPGEEVITNRRGEADRFRRDRELGLIPAYAQGGTIGDYPGYARGGKVRGVAVKAGGERDKDIAKMWDRAAKTTARALENHGKQLDRATDRLDYWNDKRKDLKSQVVGSLTRNWMGDGSTNIWGAGAAEGTAAYAQQQWAQQIKDSKALSGNIANLRKNGAGDAFIAEILRSEDPLAAARMFNKQSVGGMRHSQKLFLEASRRAQGAGTFGSNVVFGDEIAKTTREVRGVRKDIKSLTKLQQLQHKQAQDSRKRNGAGKATSAGSRARTRSKKG